MHSQLPWDIERMQLAWTWHDKELAAACVNACGQVNPSDPIAAAEAYEGLVVSFEYLLRQVDGCNCELCVTARAALSAARKGMEK